jgi:GTP cyclohydrolase II
VSHADDRRLCGTLLRIGTSVADTTHGAFHVETFLNLSSRALVLVLRHGDVRGPAPLLARVHSSCMTSECFGGCDCDCAGQLDAALAAIAGAGRGAVFYLLQEGRGAGFVAKARDRMMVQASCGQVTTFDAYARMGLGRDYRRYDEVGFAAAALGITAPLMLLSNNPDKLAALQRANVALDRVVPLALAASQFNLHYLAAKSRSGHALEASVDRNGAPAVLPESVTYFDPHALAERPRFLRVASYLLPIRSHTPGIDAHWFRLHAYFDLATRRERVVFTYARNGTAVPLVSVERDTLAERFPLRARRRGWRGTVERIARRGAGAALFVLHDDPAAVAPDDDLTWLLAHHLAARRADILTEEPTASPAEHAVVAALARHAVDVQFALPEPE